MTRSHCTPWLRMIPMLNRGFVAKVWAVSRRRGNEELLEGFAWGQVAQARSGAFVELFGDGGEVGLVVGDVGALGQVLTDQTVGVLVGSALPR